MASGSLTFSGSDPIVTDGGVTLNGASAIVNVTNTQPTVIATPIYSNAGYGGTNQSFAVNTAAYFQTTALIKQGVGTLTLGAADVYWGPTLVQQGIVNVENSAALGNSGNEVQTISFGGAITGGYFTLSFNYAGQTATTVPIVLGVIPTGTYSLVANIQGAIDGLPNVGQANTIVATGGNNSGLSTGGSGTSNGPTFTITFVNALADQNLPLMTINFVGTLLPPTATATTTITTTGNPALGTVVSAGATVQIQGGNNNLGGSSTSTGIGNRFTLQGTGVGGLALENLDGNNTVSGPITLAAATTITVPTGTLYMNGIYTGGGDLTEAGGGTLYLSGLSTNYTGEITINGIMEAAVYPAATGSDVSGTLVNAGGTFLLGGGYVGVGESLTLNGNGFGFVSSSGLATARGALVCSNDGNAGGTNMGNQYYGDITLGSNVTISSLPTPGNGNGGVESNALSLTIEGNISDGGQGFGITKVGGGWLTLAGADTYSGPTTVTNSILFVADQGTLRNSTVSVGVGATFCIDDTAADIQNRYTQPLNLGGGAFVYLANNNFGVTSTETQIGTITLVRGNSTISSVGGLALGDQTKIQSAGLNRNPAPRSPSWVASATRQSHFQPAALVFPALGTTNQILFASPPFTATTAGTYSALTNGILPYATVTIPNQPALSFATYTLNGIAALPTTDPSYATSFVGVNANSNVAISSSASLPATNLTVNARTYHWRAYRIDGFWRK